MNIISNIDYQSFEVCRKINLSTKSKLGQFMTPSNVAHYMAGLLCETSKNSKLLDCGAGIGSLTVSVINRLGNNFMVELWELDKTLALYLEENITRLNIDYKINVSDFIQDAVINIIERKGNRYTHAILNPPYGKISNNSYYKKILKNIGIDTINLYSAFLSLTIMLMEDNGEIVAIIPRSFCNGPYYKSFRNFLFSECSIEHIHVFGSRDRLFKYDNVLQENIIIKLKRNKNQSAHVVISSSFDDKFLDYKEKKVSFENILKNDDHERFIHIPIKDNIQVEEQLFKVKLDSINLEVSTGSVVDFRMKEFLKQEPSDKTAPLLYPHHFATGELFYPKNHKKLDSILITDQTRKWLMPNGFYVLVKRFTAKEERKRIVAYLLNPNNIKGHLLGFENHWNVFHYKKSGIDEIIAKGLLCFLNSTKIDNYFRVFSGHTQVNATDLRNLLYPDIRILQELGVRYQPKMPQNYIDELINKISYE